MREFTPEEKELIVNTPITADILGFKELTPPANKIVEALEVLLQRKPSLNHGET